jgi:hypothetical protein
LDILNRLVAATLCVSVFCMGLTPARARAGRRTLSDVAAPAAEEPAAADATVVTRSLRDAIPAASFVAAPPDSVEEDDFFLPTETDNKKLLRDITVFVIVSVFVAFFIVKVFIEKDDDPPPDSGGGKPVPLPQ